MDALAVVSACCERILVHGKKSVQKALISSPVIDSPGSVIMSGACLLSGYHHYATMQYFILVSDIHKVR